jgi:hypothetical protein
VLEGWERLSKGQGRGIVLALDFEAVGRPEACFSDLVALLGQPPEIWAAAQPPGGADGALTADAYLGYWSAGLREGGREISGILGFCAGAVFAAALAEQVARWQSARPVTVLLDPEPPTAATMLRQFSQAMRGLASVASKAELAPVQQAADRLSGSEALPSLGAALTALYREATGPAFARIGLKAEYQADLMASFGSLMCYLAAAHDVRVAEGWASATAVLSATAPCEPAGVARRLRTGVDHAGLLGSPAVARLVAELLEAS